MIVKLLRSWGGHTDGAIIELGLQEGRRALEVGIATTATLEEVKKSIEMSPEDKMIRKVRTKTKRAKSSGRKKKTARRSKKGSD